MKLEFCEQVLEKYSNVKFLENISSGSRMVPRGQTKRRMDGRTNGQDRQDEAISRFSKFCESPQNNLDLVIIFCIYLEREILL